MTMGLPFCKTPKISTDSLPLSPRGGGFFAIRSNSAIVIFATWTMSKGHDSWGVFEVKAQTIRK